MKFKRNHVIFLVPLVLILLCLGIYLTAGNVNYPVDRSNQPGIAMTELPSPDIQGRMSVEKAINNRRSVRNYTEQELSLEEISQLLWAAQGITSEVNSFRTAPSAGATYPLEVYMVVDAVAGLERGIYKYYPKTHEIGRLKTDTTMNRLADLVNNALYQSWIKQASALLIIAAVYERTTSKYSDRGKRYVYMEAGHVAQNVYLQATALGLGTVTVGAFRDQKVQSTIGMKSQEKPLYIMPIGNIK